MTEPQANIIIAILFFLLANQYQDRIKIWSGWWALGCLYMFIAAFEGLARIFS